MNMTALDIVARAEELVQLFTKNNIACDDLTMVALLSLFDAYVKKYLVPNVEIDEQLVGN
jgi:hypothetical protein